MNPSNNRRVQNKILVFPWWISILVAIALYCVFRYLLPNLSPTDPALEKFFGLAYDIAPVITIPFLLLGAKQLYDGATPGDEVSDYPDQGDRDESRKHHE